MSRTFHGFPKLPYDIREQIWNLAIRDPDVPGVHFFGLRSFGPPDPSSKLENLVFTSPGCSQRCCLFDGSERTRLLGCPKNSRRNTWEHNNPSTYLHDSGLWSACEESNLMIRRKLLCNIPDCREHGPEPPSLRDCCGSCVTGLYQDRQLSPPRLLTVIPDQDLFVFDVQELNKVATESYPGIHSCLPFLNMSRMPHIGIEYDPDWFKAQCNVGYGMLEDDDPCHKLFRAIRTMREFHNVYLIDYDLDCREYVRRWERHTGESATAFEASEGRFVSLTMRSYSIPGDTEILGPGLKRSPPSAFFCCQNLANWKLAPFIEESEGRETLNFDILGWIPHEN